MWLEWAGLAARLWLGFFILWRIPRMMRATRGRFDPVAVVVPARNEAESLPNLLESISRQSLLPAELVVVDDGSTDATAAVAAAAGAQVVVPGPVPEGWTGKSWACWSGAESTSSQVIVFIDADVRLTSPSALEDLVGEPERSGGLVSVQPFHVPVGTGEQMAAFFNLISMMGTGLFIPRPPPARVAFGPVLACRREDYLSVGGHESVKGAVLDDAALAARFRAAKLPVTLRGGRGSVEFRMYPRGLGQMIEGFTKNFAAGARTTSFGVMVGVALWLSGVIAAPFTSPWLYAVYVAQIWWLLRKVGRFAWWVPVLYPIPLALFLVVFARSLLLMLFRRPVRWKGRLVAPR